MEKYKLKLLPICQTDRVTLLSLKLFKNSRALLTPYLRDRKLENMILKWALLKAASVLFTDETDQ